MDKILSITTEELEDIKDKKVGSGKDGVVLKYNSKELLKIYHKRLIKVPEVDLKQEVKIYIPDQIKMKNAYKKDVINYKANDGDKDYVKLGPEKALMNAIERQKFIKKTHLPKEILYVDERFAGCVLHRLYGLPIHNLIGILTKKKKKKILLDILDALNELYDNYIYHCDLSNNPYSTVTFIDENDNISQIKGHSHVLINPLNHHIDLIDLDGHSTVYTERKNNDAFRESIFHFKVLIMEFLLKLEEELINEILTGNSCDNLKNLKHELMKLNINSKQIDTFLEDDVSTEQIEDFIRTL